MPAPMRRLKQNEAQLAFDRFIRAHGQSQKKDDQQKAKQHITTPQFRNCQGNTQNVKERPATILETCIRTRFRQPLYCCPGQNTNKSKREQAPCPLQRIANASAPFVSVTSGSSLPAWLWFKATGGERPMPLPEVVRFPVARGDTPVPRCILQWDVGF